MRSGIAMAIVLGLALAAGCAQNPPATPPAGEEVEVRMGVVEEVRRVPLPAGGGYIGVMGGATVGGIAGGSLGGGRGSQAAATVGVIAGSIAGRALESAAADKEGLEIAVRLDSGSVTRVLQPDGETFKSGDRVRVVSGAKGTRVTH